MGWKRALPKILYLDDDHSDPEKLVAELRRRVGDRAGYLRQMQGMELSTVADAVQLSEGELREIERGSSENLGFGTVVRLAHALGVNTYELLLPRGMSRW